MCASCNCPSQNTCWGGCGEKQQRELTFYIRTEDEDDWEGGGEP